MKASRKIINGVVHVWSIMDNEWMPETEWDAREVARKAALAGPERCPCGKKHTRAEHGVTL